MKLVITEKRTGHIMDVRPADVVNEKLVMDLVKTFEQEIGAKDRSYTYYDYIPTIKTGYVLYLINNDRLPEEIDGTDQDLMDTVESYGVILGFVQTKDAQ
jgi:hypothetical protein